MEFIKGESLEHKIYVTGINLSECFKIAKEIAKAMNFLHSKENPILHRDLKPANVLISKKGEVKITDFGISVELERVKRTGAKTIYIYR